MNKHSTNEKVKLSLIMPVYNGEEYLKSTMECILNQTFDNFELIILDNQSNDSSPEIIKSFQDKDNRIKYILDTKKRNGNDCFSELVKYTSGKYLICLNDDNYMDKCFFLKLINKIQEKNSDMVVCNGFYINEEKGKKKKFFENKIYFNGSPSILKLIKFFFRGDVIPLFLSSIIVRAKYLDMLPFINLSKFENDADTLMGIKILSNLKIEKLDDTLFNCRVYDHHVRYHSNKLPSNYLSHLKEKIIHDFNLLNESTKTIFKSKLSVILKINLIIFFPFLLVIKRIKNILIEIILKLRSLI